MDKKSALSIQFFGLLVGLGLVMSILTACGGTSQPTQAPAGGITPALTTPAIDAAGLLDQRCSVCHPSTRAKTAQKTQAEWQQTVDRMISKGAQLTDAERAALIDYLAKTYGK
jgi:hypothetical protein